MLKTVCHVWRRLLTRRANDLVGFSNRFSLPHKRHYILGIYTAIFVNIYRYFGVYFGNIYRQFWGSFWEYIPLYLGIYTAILWYILGIYTDPYFAVLCTTEIWEKSTNTFWGINLRILGKYTNIFWGKCTSIFYTDIFWGKCTSIFSKYTGILSKYTRYDFKIYQYTFLSSSICSKSTGIFWGKCTSYDFKIYQYTCKIYWNIFPKYWCGFWSITPV